jgi:hypothetical protein
VAKNRIIEGNGEGGIAVADKSSKKGAIGVQLQITAPNMQVAAFAIEGASPLVLNKFSKKAEEIMMATQRAGQTAKKGQKREPKNFEECYEQARYKADDGGWDGIPAIAFRAAMVSACRLVNFKMTFAKQAFGILQDGKEGAIPLVRITKGDPKMFTQAVRNANGNADIRARPMWDAGWQAIVRVRFDADLFKLVEIANLLSRAGLQVGIGEGRMASRDCVGCGWGEFVLLGEPKGRD